tara:strand:- start:1316 stop:1642 length:327 start_codon:yes stop_codon:yes gene_type:complete
MLTNQEKSWIQRKKLANRNPNVSKDKKGYNPHYEKFGKNNGDLWERNEHIEIPLPFTKEAEQWEANFTAKYGRAWYYFQGWSFNRSRKNKNKKYWVEQYMHKNEEDNE